jgi:hypothetical protein
MKYFNFFHNRIPAFAFPEMNLNFIKYEYKYKVIKITLCIQLTNIIMASKFRIFLASPDIEESRTMHKEHEEPIKFHSLCKTQ